MKQSLLARARVHGTPLIEGARVTWLWRGRSTPALVGDFNQWDVGRAPRFRRVAPDLFACTLALSLDAYIEYAFRHGTAHRVDPLNPRQTPNGLGGRNSYFYMPRAAPTPLISRTPGRPHGTLTRHAVQMDFLATTRPRAVWLYQPPAPGPYPLLVVWDGADYLRRVKLPAIVDNLIAQQRIRPMALALVASDGPARLVEYGASDITLLSLTQQILPLARKHLPLLDWRRHHGAYGVLGASMGGLMALYTGLRLPHIFGRVLSQSGAFAIPGREFVTSALVRHSPRLPLKIWMSVGRYEWLLGRNRAMYRLLKSKRYAVTYREYNTGHNYPAWRDEIANGLEVMFGE